MIFEGLNLIFWILSIIAFGMSAWALFHSVRTPARAFAITGKQSKKLWLIILSLATLFSFASAVGYFGSGLGQLNFFAIAFRRSLACRRLAIRRMSRIPIQVPFHLVHPIREEF